MCGRFAIDERVNAMIEDWVEAGHHTAAWRPDDWIPRSLLTPRYSVAPSERAPVRRWRDDGDGGAPIVVAARWGFDSLWSAKGGPHPINARIETVATRRLFREAFAASRCVVAMSGYFEWVQQPDGRQPYYLSAGSPLLAAGIITTAPGPTGGWEHTFAIITRQARDAAGTVHDRMPALLPLDQADDWICPRTSPAHGLRSLTDWSAQIAATLVARPVSRTVNRTRGLDASDPRLIAPVDR